MTVNLNEICVYLYVLIFRKFPWLYFLFAYFNARIYFYHSVYN
jgi:hypothetical protein